VGALVAGLAATSGPVRLQRLADDRHIVYLTCPVGSAAAGGPRLVSGDLSTYVDDVVEVVRELGAGSHAMVVGLGVGGAAAVALAARDLGGVTVDHVVTVSSPAAQVPRVADDLRVLSLEDRSDPVALFGSLVNAGSANRVTLVFDAAALSAEGAGPYVAGGRAADRSDHPDLRAEIERMKELGYLAS
jgi:pimeloyl-ACP methyl ester carboxylesterase